MTPPVLTPEMIAWMRSAAEEARDFVPMQPGESRVLKVASLPLVPEGTRGVYVPVDGFLAVLDHLSAETAARIAAEKERDEARDAYERLDMAHAQLIGMHTAVTSRAEAAEARVRELKTQRDRLREGVRQIEGKARLGASMMDDPESGPARGFVVVANYAARVLASLRDGEDE